MKGGMACVMLWLGLCLTNQVQAFLLFPYRYHFIHGENFCKYEELNYYHRNHCKIKSGVNGNLIFGPNSMSTSMSMHSRKMNSSKSTQMSKVPSPTQKNKKIETKKKKISGKIKATRAKTTSSSTASITGIAKKTKKATAKRKRASKKKTRKKKKTSKIKKVPEEEPLYFWRNKTDVMTIAYFNHLSTSINDHANNGDDESQDSYEIENNKSLHFLVRGNPVPLARHRSYRGFIFNPSAKKQQQFCNVVLDMLPLSHFENANITDINLLKTSENVIPFFHADEALSVNIICRMKRPKIHFVSSKPGPGRLRQSSMSRLQITRQDVDNFAKFVLDSLNGVLYVDDRQIASLHIVKIYDDDEDGLWKGSTEVKIKKMTEKDMEDILPFG